jgi:hypothetical protein
MRVERELCQRGFHAGAQLPVGGIEFGLHAMQFGQGGLVVVGFQLVSAAS